MAEIAKVRLVRCPKCENLLPEVPEFSVYQCGGCGAVLKAKTKGIPDDDLSEKSEEKGVRVTEEVDIVNASEVETESNDKTKHNRANINNAERAENTRLLADSELRKRGKERVRRFEHFNSDYTPPSQGLNLNNNQITGRQTRPPMESLTSGRVFDQWGGATSAYRAPAHGRSNIPLCHDEGQSSHNTNSYFGDGSRYDLGGSGRVENLENGRAELLRKLDELKDQLTRSCDVAENYKENINMGRKMVSQTQPDPYNRHYPNSFQEAFSPYDLDTPYLSRGLYPPQRGYNGNIYRPENPTYMHQQYPGPYPDLFMLNRPENFFHQPACSCVHCYNNNNNKKWDFPPKNETLNPIYGSSNLHQLRSRMVNRSGLTCRPVFGGAPFVTCCNCLEVLKVPGKGFPVGKMVRKMKCGACSSIISLEFGEKGIIGSVSVHVDQDLSEVGEENVIYWNPDSDSGEFEKMGRFSSSPENEASKEPDSEFTDSPLVGEFKNSPRKIRSEKGNKSKRSDKADSRQSSVKDSVASEMDDSFNEFPNSYKSQETVETSKDDQPKAKRSGESFFAGLVKKGFKEFAKSNRSIEVRGSEVFVNGHFVPDRAVKKAEKLAGPIQPGEYWYDIQAGFWGVMGHPCLGIVMPNIEEFNYPMPEKCAAGNTGIFVNGRELHQKDFDLLSSRGLPITRHKSYVLEISGKVIDEQSGEELDGLGKLAPTVEKAKHGFGMKVPKFLAQVQN